MKGKPKLHILYEYQLNNYLTVGSVVKSSQKLAKIAHISVCDIHACLKTCSTTVHVERLVGSAV